MDPATIMNLALVSLQAVLQLIAQIKGQSGLTDDQILVQALAVAEGNDKAYAALVAALSGPQPPHIIAPAPEPTS
jgi:hypothetical protein